MFWGFFLRILGFLGFLGFRVYSGFRVSGMLTSSLADFCPPPKVKLLAYIL